MSDNVIQLYPDLPEDYCIGLDDLDNQDEIRKMLECLDMQVAEALSAVSGDINPVNGYVRARNILQCAFDQTPMEETPKMLDAYFLQIANSRGRVQAQIIEEYLKGIQGTEP